MNRLIHADFKNRGLGGLCCNLRTLCQINLKNPVPQSLRYLLMPEHPPDVRVIELHGRHLFSLQMQKQFATAQEAQASLQYWDSQVLMEATLIHCETCTPSESTV